MPAARRYLPGTMVLETSWGTRGGWIIVRDVLLIGPWHHENERSHTHRRAPTDYDADHVLLRTDPLRERRGAGQPRLRAGRSTTGALPAHWEYDEAGYHEAVADAPRGRTSRCG